MLVDHIAARLYCIVCGFVLAVQGMVDPKRAAKTALQIASDLDQFSKILNGAEDAKN